MPDDLTPAAPSRPQKWQGPRGSRPDASAAAARRQRAIIAVSLAMAALAAGAYALSRLIHPFKPPEYIAVPFTEYSHPLLPVNAFAEADVSALTGHFAKQDKEYNAQDQTLLRDQLDRLERLPPERSVVVYFAALALTRDDVYLLPADASPDSRDRWLSLSRFLASLKSCRCRHKLLILDLAKPIADPRLGQPADDVPEMLAQRLDGKDPDLWVLMACAPGQVSLVSEEMGQSVFGYYVKEGFLGWADGYGEERPNGQVTVKELCAFVRARVDRWARQNRRARQTPVVFPGREDFQLVAIPHLKGNPRQEALAPDIKYWSALKEQWATRDKARESLSTALFAPQLSRLALRQFEASLLRAEDQWRGGVDDHHLDAALDLAVRDYRRKGTASQRTGVPHPHSLALVDDQPTKDQAGAVAEFSRELRAALALPKLPSPKEEPALKVLPEARKKILEPPAKETQPSDPQPRRARLARAVWDVAVEHGDLTRDRIEFLLQWIPDSPALYAEMVFLKRLRDREIMPDEWPSRAISEALRAIDQTEKAAATVARDARLLPWVAGPLQPVLDQMRKNEVALFTGQASNMRDTAPLSAAAAQKAGDLAQQAERLRQVLGLLDDAWDFLPRFVPYLNQRPDPVQVEDFLAAAESTRTLERVVTPPADDSAVPEQRLVESLEEAERHARVLRALLTRLRRPLDSAILKDWQAQTLPDDQLPLRVVEIDQLLETSVLDADTRAGLWSKRRELAQRLHQDTRVLDHRDDAETRTTDPPPADELATLADREHRRAVLRARASAALLRMAGVNGLDGISANLLKNKVDSDSAEKLRVAWARTLPEDLRAQLAKRNWLTAERLLRVENPLEAPAAARADDPSARLWKARVQACWRWYAKCCSDRAFGSDASDAYAEFFRTAAGNYGILAAETP